MIERKRYLELCQKNAVNPGSVTVKYKSGEYYPATYIMQFDKSGKTINTAVLHSEISKSYTQARLEEVEE